MRKINLILFAVILPFLAIMTSVSANTLSNTTAGYGYTPVVNGTAGTRSWVSYNSNNLVNYGYNLSDTNYYNIDEFNIRFNITGNFSRGTSYTVTFTWDNYHPTIDTNNFYADWILMTHELYCYSSSWSSTGQTGSNCFTSSNISATQNGNNSVNVTITFVPSATFYGLALVNQHGSTFTFYKSVGWEVHDLAYTYSTDGSQDIINNANQNTQNIINNQDSNTQDIINNQNQNTQAIIDSNYVCDYIDKSNIVLPDKTLRSDGTFNVGDIGRGVTSFYNITKGKLYLELKTTTINAYACFYDTNKEVISCFSTKNSNLGEISIPINAVYFRGTIVVSENLPTFKLCKSGQQAITDSLTDDDVGESTNNASNFFSSFQTDTYGLSSVITAPLSLIQNLSSATCSDLVLPLPYVNKNLTLPCMTPIYQQNFSAFLTLYQSITFGIVSYWVIVRIFNLVKDFKNPDHDEVEVMDL